MLGWFIAVGEADALQRPAFHVHLPAVSVTSTAEKVIISSAFVRLFVWSITEKNVQPIFTKFGQKGDRYVSRDKPLDYSDNPYNLILGSD